CIPIFNANELAQSDWVSAQQSADVLARKLEAFGYIVRVIDGHEPKQIMGAFAELPVVKNGARPMAIVAKTVKGWGASDEQGTGKHGTPVKKDALPKVLGELDQTARDLGVAEYKLDSELKIPAPKERSQKPEAKSQIRIATFAEACAMVGLDKDLSANK